MKTGRPRSHPERDAAIAADYLAGDAIGAICVRHGVNPSTVDNARKRAGIPPRRVKPVAERKEERIVNVAARLAAIPSDTRSITGQVVGDPLPGRSALDQKRAGVRG